MKRIITQTLPILAFIFSMSFAAMAQTKLAGNVRDAASKEALIGVSISVKGKVIGTISDAKGNYSLSTTTPVPFTLAVSMVGYESQEIVVSSAKSNLNISLKEQATLGQEVVVSASRIQESVLQSPVTIERMDIRAIRESAAPSFYDALRNLKGVETSTQSVSFSSINMRGFNSNGNTRVVQLIDGMDNQAPGLNFSVGNIVGISELDLEGLELLPGAASALYGPNALNGIILMNSKSPFLYQGLSAQVKVGAMSASNRTEATTPYSDIAIRYAKAINNKWAYKVNFNTMSAEDWQATDYRDQSLLNGTKLGPGSRMGNLAYNGVSIFGDETNVEMLSSLTPLLGVPSHPLTAGINQISKATGGLLSPTAILNYIVPKAFISREGYKENDLASYANRNMKFNAALHYRFNDNVELILQGSYGSGTTVYTGADRYSIKNFGMGQYKAELKGSNFFLRAYTTQENSGDAYATGTLGQLVNEAAKPSTAWYPDYFGAFAGAALQNFGTVLQTTLAQTGNPTAAIGNAIANTQGKFAAYHDAARLTADAGRRLVPGTAAFNAAVEAIKNKPLPIGGKFTDKSALYHYEGMYNFTEKFNKKLEMIVGASYQVYALNSEGSLFALKADGSEFTINEFGGYIQVGKKMFADKFKLTGSMRYDKNENFEGQFSPRLTGVLTQGRSNFRASYQTGFRIPSTQDQFIDLNTPQARLLGGLPVVQDRYKLSGNSFTLQSLQAGKPEMYTAREWKPEQVKTIEFGYKGFLGDKLLADFYIYQSNYLNFNAAMTVVQLPTQHKDATVVGNKVFNFPSNVQNEVVTNGWGLSLDYQLGSNWALGTNVSYNAIKDNGGLVDYQLAFNTPNYRTNVTLGNRNIGGSGWGFSTAWRFQDQFVWQSGIVNQVVNQSQQSLIPAFHTLDAQVSKKLSAMKTILKVGGSNLLGAAYTTGWSNPTVGSIYYVSLTFDQLLNK